MGLSAAFFSSSFDEVTGFFCCSIDQGGLLALKDGPCSDPSSIVVDLVSFSFFLIPMTKSNLGLTCEQIALCLKRDD